MTSDEARSSGCETDSCVGEWRPTLEPVRVPEPGHWHELAVVLAPGLG